MSRNYYSITIKIFTSLGAPAPGPPRPRGSLAFKKKSRAPRRSRGASRRRRGAPASRPEPGPPGGARAPFSLKEKGA